MKNPPQLQASVPTGDIADYLEEMIDELELEQTDSIKDLLESLREFAESEDQEGEDDDEG